MENAENALILLYDLCRLCLDEPGVNNIFKPVDWSQDILFYTGVKVTTEDKLPQLICTSCRDIMNCAKILKDIAKTNEKRLQQISGLGDLNQVLVSKPPSHLIIITPCTEEQNDLDDGSAELRSSVDQNFRSRIVFESEDEALAQPNKTEKQSKKKRKSSKTGRNADRIVFESENDTAQSIKTEKQSKKERTSITVRNASKVISVRKDLFDTSTFVMSTKKRNESPSSTSSPCKDSVDNKALLSTKKCKQSPTSTSNNVPTKTVKVDGKELKVYDYDFKCETCSKTYATYKRLYFHQLTHNKKFQCPLDVCCKKFASKGDLQKHIRSHTGEKPYKCDLCDLSFTQNVTLKSHKRNIHNEPS